MSLNGPFLRGGWPNFCQVLGGIHVGIQKFRGGVWTVADRVGQGFAAFRRGDVFDTFPNLTWEGFQILWIKGGTFEALYILWTLMKN